MTRPDKWFDVSPRSAVRAVAKQALAMRLARVAKNLKRAAKASAKQAEDIHRLRTWSRRAAAAVALLRPLLAGKQANWFDKKLRKIRRGAGEVRDLDVMCKQLEQERPSRETSDLLGDLQNRRKDAQQPLQELQKRLGKSGKLLKRERRLLKDVSEPPAEFEQHEPPDLRTWTVSRLAPQVKRFLSLGEKRLARVEVAHEFRIAGKELRYVIEIVGGALPPAAVKAYALLGELQQRIGTICDHAAAERMYVALLEKSSKARRKYLRSIIAAERKSRSAAHKRFLRWWTKRRREELEKSLAAAVRQ